MARVIIKNPKKSKKNKKPKTSIKMETRKKKNAR
jgi:hypothetical protein